jgi:hypothetical protein
MRSTSLGAADGGRPGRESRGEKVLSVADALRERGVLFVFSTGHLEWALPDVYKDVPCCETPIDMRRLARALFG